MASIMPPVPRVFFLYIEPALCLFGALQPLLDPRAITGLLPAHFRGPLATPEPTPLETLLALQNGTLLFMMAGVTLAVMLYASASPRAVHAYVLMSALTDLPHWASFARVLGLEGLREWRTWGSPLWLQLGVPVIMCGIKVGYLTGAFGEDRVPETGGAGKAKGKRR